MRLKSIFLTLEFVPRIVIDVYSAPEAIAYVEQ